MTAAQQISALLLRFRNHPVCDQCIANTIGLDLLETVEASNQLCRASQFVRDNEECSECGRFKTTTRYRAEESDL